MLQYKRNVQTGGELKLYFKQKPEDNWKEIPKPEWARYWESEFKIVKMNLEAVTSELEEATIKNNELKGRIMQLEAQIELNKRKSTFSKCSESRP
jgi:hypothetical protein